MEISLDTLALAIKAVQHEMDRHKQFNKAPGISEEEAGDHAEYAMDLLKAFSELGQIYSEMVIAYPGYPNLDELTAKADR